jgi:plastocyanin
MRWLHSAVVGAGLVLAGMAVTAGEAEAQAIRPQPVYPSAPPGYSFQPGQDNYSLGSTLSSRSFPRMPYGDPYGPYGPRMGRNGGAGMYSSAYPSTPQTPQGPPPVEVTVYDNSFFPSVLYVAPGAVVRWTNKGRHRHTVTSDEGFWDSGELRPGEGYAVYFPLPGRYYYHCKLHERDMRGWVVVQSGY